MRTILTCLFMILGLSISLQAQNTDVAFKLYTNLYYLNADPIPSFASGWGQFKGLTPAVTLFDGDAYHELEFSNLRFSRDNRQLEEQRSFLVGFRYEYGQVIDLGWGGENLTTSIGGAARFYHYNQSITPKQTSSFESSIKQNKVVFAVVPRLLYRLNDSFSIDLNTSISVVSAGFETTFYDNPLISEQNRDNTTFDFDILFFSSPLLRLGIVYHLSN